MFTVYLFVLIIIIRLPTLLNSAEYTSVELNRRKVRLMKPTHDSLLLRVSCLRTHQTLFSDEYILSDECVSTKLGVTVNHVLVSLASPFYDSLRFINIIVRKIYCKGWSRQREHRRCYNISAGQHQPSSGLLNG